MAELLFEDVTEAEPITVHAVPNWGEVALRDKSLREFIASASTFERIAAITARDELRHWKTCAEANAAEVKRLKTEHATLQKQIRALEETRRRLEQALRGSR